MLTENIKLSHPEPSKEQRDGLDKCIHHLFKKNIEDVEPVFLTGAGGVGKSFTMGAFLRDCIEKGFKPFLTAPTHVAKERLIGLHPDIDPITIHAFLNYGALDVSYGDVRYGFRDGPGEYNFNPEKDILIVDEASMLQDEFIDVILHKTSNRVLFVGDAAQIPPITDNDRDRTRILTENESVPGVIRKIKNVIELTKSFRQKEGSALIQVCNHLRESIFTGKCIDYYFSPSLFLNEITKIIEDTGDRKSVYTNIDTKYIVDFLIKRDESVFIAYGNPTVNAVQSLLPEWYTTGGTAIVNGAVLSLERDKNAGKIKSTMLLPNNTRGTIDYLKKRETSKFGILLDKVVLNGVSCFAPNNPDSYNADIEELRNLGRKNESNRGRGSFDEDNTPSNWSISNMMSKIVILRDSRVSTCHKSQGLQWKRNIVSLSNILFSGKNMNPSRDRKDIHRKIIAMKILYTAISRTQSQLLINNRFNKAQLTNSA